MAILFGRPDLLVLAAPFVVIVAWSLAVRPHEAPTVEVTLGSTTLREGEATSWTATVNAPGADAAIAVVAPSRTRQLEPASGLAVTDVAPGGTPASLAMVVRSTHWGRSQVGPSLFAAHSAWGAFRSGPAPAGSINLTTLPLPAVFDTSAPAPHPQGLVGLHRSTVRGDGSEFATIRPFQLGDRLRRVHWPVSLRTGTIHVATTHTDRDTEVVIVLDAGNDVGESGGVDGAASSLDLAVRAAGAIAEHFLRRGDRVGLRTFATMRTVRLNSATGASHLRRLLTDLAAIEVGTAGHRRTDPPPLRLHGGCLVVMLSPMLSPAALQQAVTLVRQQHTVLVVDTLPDRVAGAAGEDPVAALAWRIRLLERQQEIRRVQEHGVPVVPWRGPGSIDQVLRDLGRRAGAPKLMRR